MSAKGAGKSFAGGKTPDVTQSAHSDGAEKISVQDLSKGEKRFRVGG
jgi:hypothetical protein